MGEKQIKYMTIEEASEYSRVPVSSLRKKISDGDLPAFKPGKSLLIDIKDLEMFIRKAKI
jgi:excisionase family DNA binding protein